MMLNSGHRKTLPMVAESLEGIMAKVQAPVKKVSAPVATVKKSGLPLLEQIARAGMVLQEADNIEWVQRAGGGGRGASPENQAIRDKANTLKIGQGFMIPKALVIVRPITNKSTGATSTLYTFKGANLVHKLEGKKFRTRRDTAGNLYLFRVTPNVVAVSEDEGDSEE